MITALRRQAERRSYGQQRMEQQLDNIFRILSGGGPQTMGEIGVGAFLLVMALSLANSLLIAQFYVVFYASRATGSQVHRAFPLLGISITAIFIAIQFSLPLSLGLLGALSIVRFRTPIKEPEEIGFIMLVIASALACATLKFAFLGILLLVALAALVIQRVAARYFLGVPGGGLIVVSLPADDDAGATRDVTELLASRLRRGRVESLSRNGEATIISYAFRTRSDQALLELQAELQRRAARATVDIFLNRTGAP